MKDGTITTQDFEGLTNTGANSAINAVSNALGGVDSTRLLNISSITRLLSD